MHVNLPNMHLNIFYILMELFINSHAQAPPSKTEVPKENFDTSLTLFVLSSSLTKFLYPFGEKLFSLLPLPSIVFRCTCCCQRLNTSPKDSVPSSESSVQASVWNTSTTIRKVSPCWTQTCKNHLHTTLDAPLEKPVRRHATSRS